MTTKKTITELFKEYASFFASKSQALSIAKFFDDWNQHTNREWSLMYDFLFRGTDPDFLPPLWSSVSLGDQVLLNETTLTVIQYYHRFGYEPVWMEGNPPDYLGEQLAFLSYLAQAALLKPIEDFIQSYTLTTAQMVWTSIRSYPGIYKGYETYLHHLVLLLSDQNLSEILAAQSIQTKSQMERTDCAPSLNPPIPDQKPVVINTGGINNCGGICVIRPTVQENCILNIDTDNSQNSLKLRACARGRGYRKTFLHPGRLRYPMKRIGTRGEGKFERISWEEAVELLTDNWSRIRDAYGPCSRFLLYGTGVTGVFHPGNLLRRLLSLDGGYLDYFNSYSSACVNYMMKYVFGSSQCGNSPADLLNTKLLILWADNTAESIFGTERNYYLAKVKAQNIPVIVIDPRLSQTGVAYGDEWYAPLPSTDAALADAMAYTIWSEGLQDQRFMDKYCIGFDEDHMPEESPKGLSYHTYLFGLTDGIPKTPEWAEAITGIEAERIRRLARRYAAAKPTCILTGLGAQRHGNGEQSAKGICMLSCLTGNVGIPGGGTGGSMAGITEHMHIRLPDPIKNPYPGKIPVFLWTRALEHGIEMTPEQDRLKGVAKLDSNIKMLFSLASNTLINQHSQIHDTIRLLKDETKCEFIVCSDIFMTPSARYADLLLPAASVFESENIVMPWAGGNYLLKNNPVIRPLFDCRFEWEWLKMAAENLGLYERFVNKKPETSQWLRESYELLQKAEPELPDYDVFSRLGGWQYKNPVHSIAFEKQIADPGNHPFPTPSGKIEIFSKRLYDFHNPEEIPAIPKYVPCPEGPRDPLRTRYPLQLIGWHTKTRCHSIHDNNPWQREVEPQGVWIHPDDAKRRQITDGQLVEIWNDRGRVRVPAIVTKRIRQGVAAMAQGGWFTPDENGTDTRGCINVLTSTRHPSPLAKGNPQHTNLVEIRPVNKGINTVSQSKTLPQAAHSDALS